MPYERARKAPTTHRHDYIRPYVADLGNVVDLALIKSSGVKIGIDPLGGAAVHYWQPIIEHYGINATVVNDVVDPTFRFMTADWDGKIRMDCSSPYAMASLIGMRDRFDVAFANDTDADRHGIVTRTRRPDEPEPLSGRRDRLSVRAPAALGQGRRDRQDHRLQLDHRPCRQETGPQAGRDAGRLQMVRRRARQRRASASPARRAPAPRSCKRDGTVWTTDKDGVDPGPAGRRNHRQDRARSEPAVCRSHRRARHAPLRAHRRAGDAAAEERAEGAHARATRPEGTRRRSGARRPGPRRPATINRLAASRSRPIRAGSPQGRRAPRTSTRSTPKVFAAKII